MTATVHGAQYDLEVVRLIRQRILAGDWTQWRIINRHGNHCLLGHLLNVDAMSERPVVDSLTADRPFDGYSFDALITYWNDTHSQAEVVALLDDVEDMLLGELG